MRQPSDRNELLRGLGDVPPPRAAVIDRARSAVLAAAAAADSDHPETTIARRGANLASLARRAVRRRQALPLAALAASAALIWAVAASPWSVTREMPDIVATGSGALDRGATSGSCSQLYSPDALDDAGLAFHGVVTAIDSGGLLFTNTVTFDVQRWYRADLGPRLTVAMIAPIEPGATSSDSRQSSTPSYSVGTHLLVAGGFEDREQPSAQGALVWQCGFTRYHDQQTALA